MMSLENPRGVPLHGRQKTKTSFQRELEAEMRDRKSRGLIEESDDESDDDGLGSDDDLLVQFNATSRTANRPGSAKQRGSPTTGHGSPGLGLRASPGLGLRASPGADDHSPRPERRKEKTVGMTAEEILALREKTTPSPKPQPLPRKGESPKPLTKEEIIFGGRRTDKDPSDLPLREEKKKWEPPSFLRNSPLHMDEPKASPRYSTRNALDEFEASQRKSSRSPDLDDLIAAKKGRDRGDRKTSDSPELRRPSEDRTSPLERKRSLKKQETIQETPEPKSRFIKTQEKDEKKKPQPKSRSKSPSVEVFKKDSRATPSYLIEESEDDSADEFLRRVKEHKVTTPSGRGTPTGRSTPDTDSRRSSLLGGRGSPDKDGRKTPTDGRKTPVDGQKTPVDGRKTPVDGRKTPVDGRKTPVDGRKTPVDGRKTPTSGRKTPKGKEEEKEEVKRKSVYDVLVGDNEEDEKKKKKKKEKEKEGDKTPSPAPRKRPQTPERITPSPKPEKPKPRLRSRPQSRDDDLLDDVIRSRKGAKSPESSVCDDVEEDPMMKKAATSPVASPGKRKGSGKQTSVRQTADDVISKVADLNEKESRTMQFIDPDEDQKKKEVKKAPKPDPKIVRPQPRYAVPKVSEDRPESARSYNSTADIRKSIYEDWYKERMKRAKEESRLKKQKEKEENEKKEKEKNDKLTENKMAYEAWNKTKENWVKDKRKAIKEKEEKEASKVKEQLEKEKEAEMAFKTWKENKQAKIQEQMRKKKKEEEKKREEEEKKKKEKFANRDELIKTWNQKKEEELIKNHNRKKKLERENKEKEKEESARKEEEAQNSYERWLENSERRENRMTLRMSQSLENLSVRPPWSPAKTLIGPRNCRVK